LIWKIKTIRYTASMMFKMHMTSTSTNSLIHSLINIKIVTNIRYSNIFKHNKMLDILTHVLKRRVSCPKDSPKNHKKTVWKETCINTNGYFEQGKERTRQSLRVFR
jgi:hypothetical protein